MARRENDSRLRTLSSRSSEQIGQPLAGLLAQVQLRAVRGTDPGRVGARPPLPEPTLLQPRPSGAGDGLGEHSTRIRREEGRAVSIQTRQQTGSLLTADIERVLLLGD